MKPQKSLLTCILLLCLVPLANCLTLVVPDRALIEGRITLTVSRGDRVVKHHLPFTELLDARDKRSAVSIGYVSHEQSKYFSRHSESNIIEFKREPFPKCVLVPTSQHFVNELQWFVDRMFHGLEVDNLKQVRYLSGPSGLVEMFILMQKETVEMVFVGTEIHRNIQCDVYSCKMRPAGATRDFVMKIYMPTARMTSGKNTNTYFTVVGELDTNMSFNSTNGADDCSFVIDYYHFEDVTNEPARFESIRDEFEMPLGVGCSEHLSKIDVTTKFNAFAMDYKQQSTWDNHFVAYDKRAGLLRREKLGESVTIWDISEEMMYKVDKRAPSSLFSEVERFQICSALKVDNEDLGSAFRPYRSSKSPPEIADLMGFASFSYMGHGSIRNMPCRIYEAILDEPPMIFDLASQAKIAKKAGAKAIDYIVQFYLLDGFHTLSDADLEETLPVTNFWPASISLIRREKDQNRVELIDSLDIYDFQWSLTGWTTKASELFMASECFDDLEEQVRVQMAIVFNKVHSPDAQYQEKQLLSYNKFQLENDLIDDIFSLLGISKVHLSEFDMSLRPHHVTADMVISDRSENKELIYFGEGNLASPLSYESNKMNFYSRDEESCVSTASHVAGASLVIFCPSKISGDSSCVVVYDESEPSIARSTLPDPNIPVCQAYVFQPGQAMKQATNSVKKKKFALDNHPIKFVAQVPNAGFLVEHLEGEVRQYDVSQEVSLVTLNHYRYAMPDSNSNEQSAVRTLTSINYRSEGDCAKACNLDVTCKSYSYCSNTVVEAGHKCVLSKLDLRLSKIQEQLVDPSRPAVTDDKQVTVVGSDKVRYVLQFTNKCSIREKNYLTMFRETDEMIGIDRSVIHQFEEHRTTFDCAQRVATLDAYSSKEAHHISMFAYCLEYDACILDEELFRQVKNGTEVDDTKDEDEIRRKIMCRVYRKKYQSYFRVSSKVMRPNADKQIEQPFESIEQCARACWQEFGHICTSFDFCTTGSCRLNQVDYELKEQDLEVRQDCLHYERDDDLSALGRGKSVDKRTDSSSSSSGGLKETAIKFVAYVLVVGGFLYGLVLGRQMNDKLERVTILRRSISTASGVRASQVFGAFPGFSSSSSSRQMDVSRDEADTNYGTTINGDSAIQLDVIAAASREGDSRDIAPLKDDF